MNIKWKSFSALTKKELYALMNLRQQVFVLEQDCPFVDADFKDQDCDHLLAFMDYELVGYLRVVKPGIQYSGPEIGRVLIAGKVRREGSAKIITKAAIAFCARKYPNQQITISAQHRLLNFYQNFGFVAQGDMYLEDDIHHIKMILTPDALKNKGLFRWRFNIHPLLILGLIISAGIIGSSFIKTIDLDQLNWIAKIDDRAISRSKYESYIGSIAQSRKSGLLSSDAENILERMIDEELLIQRAVDLGMLENDGEIRSILIQKMISLIISEANDLKFSKEDLQKFFDAKKDFFTPSPKLHLVKLSFANANINQAKSAREFLLAGKLSAAKLLAEPEVIKLPNTLLPAMKVREYIGPFLTQAGLNLDTGEVSDLIELDGQIHLLVSIQTLVQPAPSFDELYEEIESEFIRSKREEMLDEYLKNLRNWYDVVKANDL